jgi:hypothetical protein
VSISRQALVAHPAAPEVLQDERFLESLCIDACLEAAQACASGADACLEEPAVGTLRDCIRAQQNCADVCLATARVLSRLGSPTGESWRALLEACRTACALCAEQCARHAERYLHCELSAAAAARGGQACAELLDRY